jgi:hypothetical protein
MIKLNRTLSHKYVSCLPQDIESAIMTEVRNEIATLLLSDEEKQEAIENANNSKVCDLTDTIKIEFI